MKLSNLLGLLYLPIVQGLIKGYNFYGLETPLRDFTCSWKHPVSYYIDQLEQFGFNSIRVPFSKQWEVDANSTQGSTRVSFRIT